MFRFFREERFKKFLFYGIIFIVFIMILGYNILTPYLSDDLIYKMGASRANSFWDLIVQQYQEYLSNNSRFITQLMIRLALLPNKMVFNIVNSAMFIFLVLLIYENVQMFLRKKYHSQEYRVGLLLLIVGMIWRYSVKFGQTILWICGACNYLWGTVIILGFITFYRKSLNTDHSKHGIRKAVLCLLFGIAAGWCSENTSGGAFLVILFFTVGTCLERKKAREKVILPYMVTAHLGVLGGMTGLLLAPGISLRIAVMQDSYTGIVAYLSRIYKCTVTIEKLFFELLCIFIVVTVWTVVCRKGSSFVIRYSCPFLIAAFAASYALILIPPPTDRAYFGAGIFLLIACLQSFAYIFYGKEKEPVRNQYDMAGKYIIISLLSLWLFFTYTENLVNLARIYREENERIALIEEAVAAAEHTVTIPQYRPAFQNRYSTAHESDLTEDPEYWINTFYEGYYHIEEIIAIPREEWNELRQ